MGKKTFEENLKYDEIAWDFKKFVEDSIVKSFEGITYDEGRQALICDDEFFKRTGYSNISVDVTLATQGYDELIMYVGLKTYKSRHKMTMKEKINMCFDSLAEIPGDASYRIIISDFEIFKRFKTMENLESEISRLNESLKKNGIKTRYDIDKYIKEFGGRFTIRKRTANDLGTWSFNKNNRFLKVFDKFLNDTISEYIKSNKTDGKLMIDLI